MPPPKRSVTGYLIERCQGASCTNFTQIAAPAGTGTTYKDTSVSAVHQLQLPRARDRRRRQPQRLLQHRQRHHPRPATPPSQPGTLTATAVSSGEVDLSWGASTDVGVSGYLIERCQGASCSNFTQIAAPAGTGTSYKDTSVSASTSYSYRVRATDAAGNLSAYSNTASATTPAASSRPGRGVWVRRGVGDDCHGRVGQRQQRHDHERDLGDDRQVRRGAAVQRHAARWSRFPTRPRCTCRPG